LEQYRTLPKAYIPLERQELWKDAFRKITSIRLRGDTSQPFANALRDAIHPGFTVTASSNCGIAGVRRIDRLRRVLTYFSFSWLSPAVAGVVVFSA